MQRKYVVTDGHLLAAMLHPRYRSLRQFSFLTDRKRADIRALLVAEVTRDAGGSGDQADEPEESSEPQPGDSMELEDLDDPPAAPVAPSKELATVVVDRYLMTPPAATIKQILDFWRTAGQQFPELQRVARFAHGRKSSAM